MADRRKFEEIVTDLRERGEDELAEELENGYGKSQLREQAGKAAALEKELAEATAKVEKLEKAPVRDKAFRDYGIDFENLRPAELEQIERYDGEFDPEKIGEFVQRYDLPTTQNGEQQGEIETPPKAAGVAAAARSAPSSGSRNQAGRITPADAQAWPIDVATRFMNEHPAAWEQLKQNETVTGITFSETP